MKGASPTNSTISWTHVAAHGKIERKESREASALGSCQNWSAARNDQRVP